MSCRQLANMSDLFENELKLQVQSLEWRVKALEALVNVVQVNQRHQSAKITSLGETLTAKLDEVEERFNARIELLETGMRTLIAQVGRVVDHVHILTTRVDSSLSEDRHTHRSQSAVSSKPPRPLALRCSVSLMVECLKGICPRIAVLSIARGTALS